MEELMASVLEATQVVPGRDAQKEEAKRLAEDARTKRARQMQALNLQRENILSQRTSQPARRTALEAALAQIDGQLAQLG
jgi:hypothetical protein